MIDSRQQITDQQQATEKLLGYLGGHKPSIALVLGSGLGDIATHMADPVIVPYSELPGFPKAGVEGHSGRLLIGRLNNVSIFCMQGRMHYYEGHAPFSLALPIRTLHAAGCRTLILTNAAGSIREDMPPGSLMMISDHINWAGVNPLIGPNDARLGPRFPDMTQAYDAGLRNRLRQTAVTLGLAMFEGVYLMCAGPNFETPAEIRAFRVLGADAVGMSTVPECLVARHCGMRVLAISTITNLAAGLSDSLLSHEETLTRGGSAAEKLCRLLERFLPMVGESGE